MGFVLIDYHKGNIRSVERGLLDAGASVSVTDSPKEVAKADAIVLPGVGAFSDAMSTLNELELASAIRECIDSGVPFLGICLGMHLLFEAGEEHSGPEGPTLGLGVIPGTVVAMPKEDSSGRKFKVPHVGWNSVDALNGDSEFSSPLFDGIDSGEFFYFTHSFVSPESDYTIGETAHSATFPSSLQKDNVFAVQFHPEKSSSAGARLIANFVNFAMDRF